MVRKVPRDIQVEVEFPEVLSKKSLVQVLTNLVKNLLHQRNQIPMQYDIINKDIKAADEVIYKKENAKPVSENIGVHSRESARTSRQTARAAKTRALFLKNSARLVKEVEEVMNMIKEEVENNHLVSLSVLFGATPISPREVFTIRVPQTTGHLTSCSRVGVYLFRAMLNNDMLHSLTSSKLPVSNTYLLFCKTSAPPTSSLRLLPSYSLPPITRCPRVTFNIHSVDTVEEMAVPIEATRRLRFTSGTSKSKLTSAIQECSPDLLYSELDSTSPVDKKSDQSDNCKNVETVLRTSRKQERMELCTPLVRRVPNHPQVFCTHAPSYTNIYSMQLCTPAPGTNTDMSTSSRPRTASIDICTPAPESNTDMSTTRPLTASMDICTPAASSRLRGTTALLDTPVSDSMELCTPAIRTRTSEEMELCTPSVSNIKLNSFVTEQVLNPCDSNLEEKDSGISSPDCSMEESDNQELYWFVTPTPIRGFK